MATASTSGATCRADWMANLPESVYNIPLNLLSIPGSHNSCSYSLDCGSPPSPGCPDVISNLCLLFGPGAREILRNWSTCQSLSLAQQLNAGVRYFDFRVTSKKDSAELFFEHGLYGTQVKQGLCDVHTFLKNHPKEIVFLDFNHFTAVPQSAHENLISFLKETYGGKLCAISDVRTLSLAQMWASDLQVIVFYHNDIVYENPELWPGDFVPAPWAKTDNTAALVDFISQNNSEGLPKDTFHVTQAILTPSPEYMMANLGLNLREAMAVKVAPLVSQFIGKVKVGKGALNICTLDFVELDGFIDKIIDLNSKR